MGERRQYPRYNADWPIKVESTDNTGLTFLDTGVLQNISAKGALGNIARPLQIGSRLEILIHFPLKGGTWMKYTGQVVRVENAMAGVNIAMKFDTARPIFLEIPSPNNP